jgi:DNA-binding transcriptional regulator LsrR (DeoR family)
MSCDMTEVELVHLYSNPKCGLEKLPKLLARATSTPQPRDQPSSRQTQVRLDARQVAELAAAYSSGQTIKELATRYGVHRVTVRALLQRHGVERRQVGLTDAQAAEACRLYPEGWSLARLAKRYDVHDMTVRRYLLLAGVVMRSPHERCSR